MSRSCRIRSSARLSWRRSSLTANNRAIPSGRPGTGSPGATLLTGIGRPSTRSYATGARTAWIADYIDSNTAQKLATRAYQAVNRVCFGQAKRVRFKSKGRGLASLEGKSKSRGLRFVLQEPEEGHDGWLVWGKERIPALN